jgi:hypothetical protein
VASGERGRDKQEERFNLTQRTRRNTLKVGRLESSKLERKERRFNTEGTEEESTEDTEEDDTP